MYPVGDAALPLDEATSGALSEPDSDELSPESPVGPGDAMVVPISTLFSVRSVLKVAGANSGFWGSPVGRMLELGPPRGEDEGS